MKGRYRTVAIRLLTEDDSPLPSAFARRSIYFRRGIGLNLSLIVGNAADSLDLSGHAPLWPDARRIRGRLRFDLAMELPFHLPRIAGKPEYSLLVRRHPLHVSLRMWRAFYGPGYPEADGWKYMLIHQAGLRQVGDTLKPHGFHPIPIRTFVTRAFESDSQTAQEAIHDRFREWQDEMVLQVATLIDAFRESDSDLKYLFPHSASSAYPVVWVATRGPKGKGYCQQFVSDLGKAVLRPTSDLNGQPLRDFRKLLSGRRLTDAFRSSLSLARTSAHYGHLGQALVQLCTAAEAALSRAFRTFLLGRGATPQVLEKYYRDITLSQLVNLHLHTFSDIRRLSSAAQAIRLLNWARSARNVYVHEGHVRQDVTQAGIEEAIDATATLVEYVLDPRKPA